MRKFTTFYLQTALLLFPLTLDTDYAPYWINMIEFIESSYINSYIIFFGMTFKKRLWRWGKKIFCKICCFCRRHKKPTKFPKYLDISCTKSFSEGNVEKICGFYRRMDDGKYGQLPYYKSVRRNHSNTHYILYYQQHEYFGPINNNNGTQFIGWTICDEISKDYQNIAIQTSSVNVFDIHHQNYSNSYMNETQTFLKCPELSALFDNEFKLWKITQINKWKTQNQPFVTYLDHKYKQLGFDKIGFAEYVELKDFAVIRDTHFNAQQPVDINGRYKLLIKQQKQQVPAKKMVFYHEENEDLSFHFIPPHLLNLWKSG